MLALIMVLIGLSRNFFGVHTPQDVLVGLIGGLLVMWLAGKLMQWVNAHPQSDWIVVLAGLAVCVAVALYANLKPYPEDYNAEGKLIVDGAKMANDTFKGVGYCMGFLIGWLLERRYVRFSTDVPMMTRLTRLVLGLFILYIVSLIIVPQLKAAIVGPVGTLISCFIQVFYISFLFPWLMVHIEKNAAKQGGKGAFVK
jgi:undecaprenyl-diphosphatase